MMKNGFTLAELLGVIAILGIISLIAVPLIDNTINKRNEDLYQTQLNQIIKGAKSYYSEHLSELPKNNIPAEVTLETLQEQGYLPKDDIINPKTKKTFDAKKTEVKVTNLGGSRFEYEVYEAYVEQSVGD